MALRNILVTGATGKQGSALINALLGPKSNSFDIIALTRKATSPSAKRLSSKPGVTVVEGNLDDISAVFKQIKKPLWGIFVVPILDKGVVKEEKQSKALIDAAIDAGVSHIVYSATDRGGPVRSENNPTSVPHFASKFNVEQYIEKAALSNRNKFTWTFLRPVAFMENINPDFFGRTFMAWMRSIGEDTEVQLVATPDIGRVGAQAFIKADAPAYRNQSISLAGDSASYRDIREIFKQQTGKEIPETYGFIASALRYSITDIRMMLAWFVKEGFGVDIPALKKEYPFMMDLKTWMKTDSAWKQV